MKLTIRIAALVIPCFIWIGCGSGDPAGLPREGRTSSAENGATGAMATARTTARPWPAFRGHFASGVADGENPPLTWDAEKGINIRWKTPIPGLGHSCPIVWGDRLFVTTAISGDAKAGLRPGHYGDPDSVNDS